MIKIELLKSNLDKDFDMSDFGELYYSIEVEFDRNRMKCTITISQRKYIDRVLKHFHIKKCKSIGTLVNVNFKLLKLSKEEFK